MAKSRKTEVRARAKATNDTQELTFPQLINSTAVSRKKKYTKSPCESEPTKFGARRRREENGAEHE